MRGWGTAVGAVAVGLTAVSLVPMADHMSAFVWELVRPIPWWRAFAPFENPPPMGTSAARPLSVLLTQLHLALWGPVAADSARALHAVVSSALLGVGGLVWGRAAGFRAEAGPAALGAMVVGPALFSAWNLPEYDAMGAGAALLAAGALWAGGRWAVPVGVAAAVLAFGLKESSALVTFGLFGASLAGAGAARDRGALRRLGAVAGAAAVGWWLLLLPLLRRGSGGTLAPVDWADRLPILEHNAVQVAHLVGMPAAAALVVGALPPRARPVGAALAVGLLVLAPVSVFYSHYEAVYYSPRWPMSAAGAAVLGAAVVAVGVGLRAWRRGEGPAPEAVAGAAVLGASALVGGALLAMPNAREDLASRIFLALAVPLFCAAGRALRGAGAPGWVLGGMVVAAPLAQGFNVAADWRARQPAGAAGRAAVAAAGPAGALVLYNHFVEMLGPQELRPFGAGTDGAEFVQVPAMLRTPDRLPVAFWGRLVDPEAELLAGRRVGLFWFAARSRMGPAVDVALVGDLAWTRAPVGLFTPYNHVSGGAALPEVAALPVINRAEDARQTTYAVGEVPLRALAAARARSDWSGEWAFVQVPAGLHEVPRRVMSGLPLVERYSYEAALYWFSPATSR